MFVTVSVMWSSDERPENTEAYTTLGMFERKIF
jgi:hypothetical protein